MEVTKRVSFPYPVFKIHKPSIRKKVQSILFLVFHKIYFSIKNRTYCTVYKVLQIRKLTRNKKIFSRCTAQLKEAYLISCYSSNTKNPIANEANVNLIIYIS